MDQRTVRYGPKQAIPRIESNQSVQAVRRSVHKVAAIHLAGTQNVALQRNLNRMFEIFYIIIA